MLGASTPVAADCSWCCRAAGCCRSPDKPLLPGTHKEKLAKLHGAAGVVAALAVLLSGHVHSCHDSAQLVLLRHLALVRPPQSLHVWLYHCRYCSCPLSAVAQHSHAARR